MNEGIHLDLDTCIAMHTNNAALIVDLAWDYPGV